MVKVPPSMAAKGYRKPTIVYHHSPEADKQFDATDLHSATYPLAGINVHASPKLFDHVIAKGQAPDALFRAGLAAPPLEFNDSGIRNYELKLKADPNNILNLSVPLGSQTYDVQSSLAKLGIRDDASWTGESLSPAELLYQRHLRADYPSDHD